MSNVAAHLILEAVLNECASAFDSGVEVVDGPMVFDDMTRGTTYLMVGFGAAVGESEGLAVSFTQEWASQTGPSRDESGSIPFTVWDMSGDDLGTARAAVFAVLDTVVSTIWTGLNVSGATILWSSPPQNATYDQADTNQGAEAVIAFSIEYRARI